MHFLFPGHGEVGSQLGMPNGHIPEVIGKRRGRYLPVSHRTSRKKRVCRKRPAGVATPSALETQFPATERISLKVSGLDAIAKATPGIISDAI